MRLSDFDDWARSHHGVITFGRSGLTKSAWYRAIQNGDLVQLHPHVARLVGTPDTPEQRIIAAVAATREPTLTSHRSAARLWGIPRPDDDPVDLIITGARRDLQLRDVVIHRPTDRRRLTPLRRYGIPCTNILRAVVDLGAVDPSGVHPAVGHAVASGLASLAAIERAASDHAARGRTGTVALRDAIADWSIDDKPADSVLEVVMRRLVDRDGLPPVEFHPLIEGHEIDFRIIGTPVLLECDGWQYHGLDRRQFEHDRERDADLISAGWIVIHFTFRAVTTRPSATANRIRAALDRWTTPSDGDLVPPGAA